MKGLFRRFLISLGALALTSYVLPSVVIGGGFRGLVIATVIFMLADLILIPFIRILLLPLNLLTLGLFAWLTNVLALYFLASVTPYFKVFPYNFPGSNLNGFVIPSANLSAFQVVVVASFLISVTIHFINWLKK